jgi:hypothetical protein
MPVTGRLAPTSPPPCCARSARGRIRTVGGLLAGTALAVCAAPATALAFANPPATSPLLTQFAGNGSPGAEVAGPALSSPLSGSIGIAIGPDGAIYISDPTTERIDKITRGGTLSVIAGNGLLLGFVSPGAK